MKYYYKLFTIIITTLVAANWGLFAQNIDAYSEIQSELGFLFENLDKSRVPTGFLLENAIDHTDLSLYDGQLSDNNYVDLPTFECILKTLKSSSVRNTSISSLDVNNTIRNMIENSEDVVALCMFSICCHAREWKDLSGWAYITPTALLWKNLLAAST